jgi:hypothetical protein
LWILLAAALCGLLAASAQPPARRAPVARLAFTAASAVLVGFYIATDNFPHQGPLQVQASKDVLVELSFLKARVD